MSVSFLFCFHPHPSPVPWPLPLSAMYSVEITVERDRVTGETRVLSTNTTLPVDLSQQGVVVYEDEQKGVCIQVFVVTAVCTGVSPTTLTRA